MPSISSPSNFASLSPTLDAPFTVQPNRRMPQTRLPRYFPCKTIASRAKCHFLTLPRSIRETIYTLAGLGLDEYIDLNDWTRETCTVLDYEDYGLLDDKDWLRNDYRGREPPARLPLSLLLVCRSVSSEAQDILYSQNCFTISYRNPGGLRALEYINTRAIQQLRTLVIRLTPCSCLTQCCTQRPRRFPHDRRSFWENHDPWNAPYRKDHDRRLSTASRRDKGLLEQWRRICSRLAAHALPGQLKLYVVCMAKDVSAAEEILQPLLQLPNLLDCGISLGQLDHPNHKELQHLAKTTVERLISTRDLERPFRFLDLPKELQLTILGYSSLVIKHSIYSRNGEYTRSMIPHNCALEESSLDRYPFPIPSIVVCPSHYAAFHPDCKYALYKPIPASCFCVSKAFADVATEIFFSGNTFVIRTWQDPYGSQEYDLIGIKLFLQRLLPNAIRYLSRLNILLPFVNEQTLSDHAAKWETWSEAIDILARHAHLPRLTLTIKIGVEFFPSEDEWTRRYQLTEDEINHVAQSYKILLQPLVQLRGLKALYIYIPYPFGGSKEQERRNHERKLEQMVMGANYDGYQSGKDRQCYYSRPFLYDEYV